MTDMLLGAFFGAVSGFLLGRVFSRKSEKGLTAEKTASVTRLLFIWTGKACIAWITVSYLLAIYATVHLGQVYTLTELSQPALTALTVTIGGKVLSNIFEHNDSSIFGTSKTVSESDTRDL